jgi:hypothetical protein
MATNKGKPLGKRQTAKAKAGKHTVSPWSTPAAKRALSAAAKVFSKRRMASFARTSQGLISNPKAMRRTPTDRESMTRSRSKLASTKLGYSAKASPRSAQLKSPLRTLSSA